MNIEQLELQMDSVIHSLRQRFGRRGSASTLSSSHGQLASFPSSAGQSPIAARDGKRQKARRSSLRSRESLKKLMRRGKLFGGEEDGSSRREDGGADETSTFPSEENLAWTAPVSPQIEPRASANNPRRRNSARLRELQRLLRAYHDQREAWLSPPASPNATERKKAAAKSAGVDLPQPGGYADALPYSAEATGQNGGRWRSPPIPLHYSRAELGIAHPFHFPFHQMGREKATNIGQKKPPVVTKEEEAEKEKKKITLAELEMALRGGRQPEPVKVWSPTSGDGRPPSSSSPHSRPSSPPIISPGPPQLPPKPPQRRQRMDSISPEKRGKWAGEEEEEEDGQRHYFRVESPRPAADTVHFQEESAVKRKKKKREVKKEGEEEEAKKGAEKSEKRGGTRMFSPAGIQQMLFRHRQRRQSEGREPTAAADGAQKEAAFGGGGGFHTPTPKLRALLAKQQARSEPRLSRSALSGLPPDSFRSSLAAFSLSPSTTASEHLERLRDNVVETKYVTAAFESRGGLGPVLNDVQAELEHWLGVDSRLLAVACEVHWSVPERYRSRQLEIQLKECLHAVLRENNRRILGLNSAEDGGMANHGHGRSRATPFPIILAKSRTEESCAREAETDAFQGIYRRFYPALLSLQDPATVLSHKGYWTMENLADGRRSPPVPRPGRFLYQPAPSQLARKSLVAVNMAVLRLRGDNRDYGADEQRGRKEQPAAKRHPVKPTIF